MTQTQKEEVNDKKKLQSPLVWLIVFGIFLFQIFRAYNLPANEMWWSFEVILAEVLIPLFTYVWLRENLPEMADNGQLFTTVKKGKIKLVKIAGKGVGYYGNLSDLNKRAIRSTGEIVDGIDTDLEESFWWKYFGVIWIGFGGSIYEYPFEKMDMVNGEIKKIKTTACSIFIKNRFTISIYDAKTSEMILIKLIAQVIVETKHAGLSLNYDNWIQVAEAQVKSTCRDFISIQKLRDITKEQLEKGGELFRCVMDQNKSTSGNISLKEQIGQEIIGFSIILMEICDKEIRDAVQSEGIAEEKIKGRLKEAMGDAKITEIKAIGNLIATQKEADGIKAIGDAKNEVLKGTADLITPKGAEELEKTKALSDAIKGHEGTLVFGEGTGIIIGNDERKKD
jgi:urease gamma subunit